MTAFGCSYHLRMLHNDLDSRTRDTRLATLVSQKWARVYNDRQANFRPEQGVRVTKKDIVRTISEEVEKLTQQQTKEVVQKTFDAIIDCLVRDGRIELRNFGVFEVKPRAARKARNPRTGEQVEVPRKHVVTFKPGKHMEARVRELDEAEARRLQDSEDGEKREPPAAAPSEPPPPSSPQGRWDTDQP